MAATNRFAVLGVVGAGNMGSGIAQKMATEGFEVVLVDVDDARVAAGMSTIERTLKEAGAAVVYREIADLSHTYPRDENARILDWFLK